MVIYDCKDCDLSAMLFDIEINKTCERCGSPMEVIEPD